MRALNYLLAATLTLVCLATLQGCKKDEDENPGETIPKVKTISFTRNGNDVTATYAYDAQGRVSTITFSGGETGVNLFTYYTDSIVELRADGSEILYHLNSAGYLDTVIQGVRMYDTNGYLISLGNVSYTWTDGNLVMITGPSDTTTATYYTDKLNTIGFTNRGMPFLGKDNKNLLKTQTINGITEIFSYEFDSKNRVTKKTSDEVEIYTYY